VERTYSVSDAAKMLGVSVKTLQRWDREGKLIANRTPGNRRCYTDSQIKIFLREKVKTDDISSGTTIKQGDYILITDPMQGSRYLKIGEVVEIETNPDGSVENYTVRFGYDYVKGKEDLDYWYHLSEICKVIKLEDN